MRVALCIAVLLCASSCAVEATSNGTFLANWMGQLRPVLGGQTVLDLSLPGTHDTMTYDLSDTVSDNANDLPPFLSWLLHEFKDFLGIGKFIHDQAKTQGLNITSQLDNGIRFLDFRVVYSAGPEGSSSSTHDWYCLHLVESNQKAITYLQEVQSWLTAHPEELIVVWVSRHGNPCGTQYPDTTPEEMQAFFGQITSLFQGMLFDSTISSLNSTTVDQLLDRNHRVVLYASDYKNFTGGSSLALDGCTIDNRLGNDVTSEPSNIPNLIKEFSQAPSVIAEDKKANKFYLRSLAGGAPSSQQEDAAFITFLPFIDKDKNIAKCAAAFNIPGMTDWCPMYLQDIGQLSNYYSQIALDAVITQGLGLPNAIYLDAVAEGGLTRTGNELFPNSAPPTTGQHNITGFAYVDTLVMWNVKQACNASAQPQCADMLKMMAERRAQNPLQRWDDPQYGRLADWPPLSGSVKEE